MISIKNWELAKEEALPIRLAVFIEEQKFAADAEVDENDPISDHLIFYTQTEPKIPVGTGRLLPDGHIGRIAVLKDYRSLGIGTIILNELVSLACKKGHSFVTVISQLQALDFYKKNGFETHGHEISYEANVPHIEMRKYITPANNMLPIITEQAKLMLPM
jgi:predicted GNAT family N-acyltransferase